MTNIVAKGANRPAAAKRTAKAAQRTPLPPKGATKGAGKGTTAEAIKDQLAKGLQAKVPQTRQMARAELLASRKAAATETPAQAPKAKTAPVRATAQEKANALVAEAIAAGWQAAVSVPGSQPGDLCTFTAGRDGELVTLHYITGGTRVGTHTNGSREVQAQNAATVRRILATPAEAAAKVRAAYASGKGKAKRQAVRVASAGPLPWGNIDLDSDVLASVQGKTITWTNSISGQPETAVVGGSGKNAPKITGHMSARALVFPAKGEGFRTVRLSSITSVN